MSKKQPRIAIVAAPYYEEIVQVLIDGARSYLQEQGIKAVEVITVPGAFEIPLGCQRLATTGKYDALIALGCIIEGKTDHYRMIRNAVTDGIMRVILDAGIPIGFGVIAAKSYKLAQSRACAKLNYGTNAAIAALRMVTKANS